jgi:hypothetical protein
MGVLADNAILILGLAGSDSTSFPFHVVAAGQPVRSFGPTRIRRQCANCLLFATTPSLDGTAIWTSTPHVHDLMKWDLKGALTEHVVFEGSPWYRAWDPTVPTPGGLYEPRVVQISQDASGIVWFRVANPARPTSRGSSQRGAAAPGPARSLSATPDDLVETLEAYDPIAGRFLASTSMTGRTVRFVGYGFVAILREEPDGHEFWDVFRADVKGR